MKKPAGILVVPVVAALVLALFAWPSARLEPRDLPIGVAGPPAAAAALEKRLSAREGAFDIHRYPTEAAAREAIEDRDVYGAFVATPGGPEVLTASAASPAVAQLLERAAEDAGADTSDVVAAGRAGVALGSSVLPLLIAGILTAALSVRLASSAPGRLALLGAGAVLAGLAATAVVQGWLDVVAGGWLANAAGLSLTVLAVAAPVAGGYALFRERGAAVAAVTMVLVGNPFSAVASAPELLPEPVGTIGQLMPPGAGANLLRSTGLFDGAGAGQHVAVLAAWAALGIGLLLAAAARSRRGGDRPLRSRPSSGTARAAA